jgi:hypothetical protein
VRDHGATRVGFTLPLPRFVLNPFAALIVAMIHVYLAAGHLLDLFGGALTWTNIWKGFGALAGAYVFLAIASRGRARSATPPRREERPPGSNLRDRFARR